MKNKLFGAAVAASIIAGVTTGAATARENGAQQAAAQDPVQVYSSTKLAPFLNGLTSLKQELTSANQQRAAWKPFHAEEWKSWTPEQAEQNKDSYSFGEYMWSVKKDKSFRALHTGTAAAKALREMQEQSGGAVVECFATDAKGGNVAQTQNTSDWFQGDEAKFTKVDSKKEPFFDKPKRDDTTGDTVVQVSFPIWDNSKFIGMVCVSVVAEKIK